MYIEIIFIVNFLLDYMILYGTKKLLKRKNKNIRIILGSIIGSTTTYLLFININNIEMILIKGIISIIMILICFGKTNIIKNITYFYLLSIIVAGTIYLLNLTNYKEFYYIILILITPLIILSIIKEWNNYRIIEKNKYTVKIYYKKKEYILEGFIDSGNRITSPFTNKGVIITNLKVNPKKIILIPYTTIDKKGIIKCFKPDKIIIEDIEIKNCLVGIVKDKINMNSINCILPNILKEKLC